MTDASANRTDLRSKIVEVAARRLQEGGPAAVTTRGVAEAAGVQAPAIYRLFGDKDGLLDAVAEHVMATYVATKAAIVETATADDVDPLEDLRAGWQNQIDFGLANPTLFRLLSDPERVTQSPAAHLGRRVLESRVHRIALTGRLRVSERRAVDLIQAAGIGTIQALLATVPKERDLGLADAMYDGVLAQILSDVVPHPDDDRTRSAAVTFRATIDHLDMLSTAERHLMTEWLDRVIAVLATAGTTSGSARRRRHPR